MNGVRILLVCGGRFSEETELVRETLDKIFWYWPFTHLVHGNAGGHRKQSKNEKTTGVDRISGEWANEKGVQEVRCPPNWRAGGVAGPIRNKRMADLLIPGRDKVVGFRGDGGTARMLEIARARGLEIIPVPLPAEYNLVTSAPDAV